MSGAELHALRAHFERPLVIHPAGRRDVKRRYRRRCERVGHPSPLELTRALHRINVRAALATR